ASSPSRADTRDLSREPADGPCARRAGLSGAREGDRLGSADVDGGRTPVVPGGARAGEDGGAPLARRHLRSAIRSYATGVDRTLSEPGIQLGRARAGAPVPYGGDRERARAVVHRPRMRDWRDSRGDRGRASTGDRPLERDAGSSRTGVARPLAP